MNKNLLRSIALGVGLLTAAPLFAQDALLAFPGAEGFGRFAKGGRGGEIYHVTNLNDSGTGSLRDAVSKPNRIVVFDVSGVIRLKSRLVFKSNLTVLGQTAPGEGVQVYGNGVSFSDANNIIVRYLRVRMGVGGDSGKDAAGVASGHDMIFDHMSVLWGRDENFSVSSNDKGNGPANVTIQNSIIGQGLQPHSCGGLIQTDNGVTLFRNLYIENATRNPKVKGLNQFVNNVSYNWGKEAAYNMGGDSAGDSWAEISGNYWITGPWKQAAYPLVGGNANFRYFAEGNWYDSNIDGTLDGHEMSDEEYARSGGARVATTAALVDRGAPKGVPEIAGRMTAPEALDYVLAFGGASLPVRDEVDRYLIEEVASFGASGSTGGITTEKALPHKGTGTLYGGYKPFDTDGDGIPDEWETANGLDPNDASDAAKIAPNGYANIENYVFTIDSPYPYMKNPTDLRAVKNEKNAVTLEWTDNSDDETGFVVEASTDGKTYSEAGRAGAGVTTLKVEGLEENTPYWLRVYATGEGTMRSVESPVLQTMTSEPFAPEKTSVVAPADGGEEQALNVTLKWRNETKDYFGTVRYNVYLGTAADALEEIATDLYDTVFIPDGIDAGTTYYWRVDAVNDTYVTEGDVWSFKAIPGGTLFYTDMHSVPASLGDSEWGTIIAGNQADIMKGVKDEVEFDNMAMGTDGGRLVAFGNLSPYPSYSSADNGASKNAIGFIGKQGKVGRCYIQINDIPAPWTITLYCGNSDKSAQSVMLSVISDTDGDGMADESRDLAELKFKTSEKKTYKFSHTYEGTGMTSVRIDRASLDNKGINFHDILIEQHVVSDPGAVDAVSAPGTPDVEVIGDAVTVNGLDGRATLRVFDMAGRVLLSERPAAGSIGFSLPKGVYVIAVEGLTPVKVAVL